MAFESRFQNAGIRDTGPENQHYQNIGTSMFRIRTARHEYSDWVRSRYFLLKLDFV